MAKKLEMLTEGALESENADCNGKGLCHCIVDVFARKVGVIEEIESDILSITELSPIAGCTCLKINFIADLGWRGCVQCSPAMIGNTGRRTWCKYPLIAM